MVKFPLEMGRRKHLTVTDPILMEQQRLSWVKRKSIHTLWFTHLAIASPISWEVLLVPFPPWSHLCQHWRAWTSGLCMAFTACLLLILVWRSKIGKCYKWGLGNMLITQVKLKTWLYLQSLLCEWPTNFWGDIFPILENYNLFQPRSHTHGQCKENINFDVKIILVQAWLVYKHKRLTKINNSNL